VGEIRLIQAEKKLRVGAPVAQSLTLVLSLTEFGWDGDPAGHTRKQPLEKKLKKARVDDQCKRLMYPQGRAAAHLDGSMLLEYARNGYPVDVGRRWSMTEILAAAKRGPHISALVLEAVEIILAEVAIKFREGYATVVYLDEIEHLLETGEWAHLKISPLAIVPHKSRRFRAILDISFEMRVFGMTIPSVNEATVVTAP